MIQIELNNLCIVLVIPGMAVIISHDGLPFFFWSYADWNSTTYYIYTQQPYPSSRNSYFGFIGKIFFYKQIELYSLSKRYIIFMVFMAFWSLVCLLGAFSPKVWMFLTVSSTIYRVHVTLFLSIYNFVTYFAFICKNKKKRKWVM